jgi:Fuc2NAc and GlcNAc transferase
MMYFGVIFFLVWVMALWLTGVLRRYAIKRSVMDVPDTRSSHSLPTPRGGGMAIVGSYLMGMLVLFWSNWLETPLLLAMAGSGGCIAAVGFMDDHGHFPVWGRLLTHLAASLWALYWLGGPPPLTMLGTEVQAGWMGYVLAATYLIWMLNLYNFMDGIDGIAGIEAITVCLGGTVLFAVSPVGSAEWMPSLLLLAATAGFLFWNFPRARIFMGDGGSGFLGMILGLISLRAAWIAPEIFLGWVMLLGVFIVDATLTLVRRVIRGERFYEAHRNHAYQYASRVYGSHSTVSIAVGLINLCWLFPLALMVVVGWLEGWVGILVAYTPLVFLAVRFKSGARELQEI